MKDRIEAKKLELMEIFSGLPENHLKIAEDLIGQAAFMAVTLEELAAKIEENGTVEEYVNGANQSGRKISSDAKLYSALIAKYTAIVTKLIKLVPPEKKRMLTPNEERHMHEDFHEAVRNGDYYQWEIERFREEWEKTHQ